MAETQIGVWGGSGNLSNELATQEFWYRILGKPLGFPQAGSDSLWPTNAERFDGEGTFLYQTFPTIQYSPMTWIGHHDAVDAPEGIPLMTRTIGRTTGADKIAFFAGVYSANNAARTYHKKGGGKQADHNVSIVNVASSFKLLNPEVGKSKRNTEPEISVQAGEQERLTEHTGEAHEARETLSRLNDPSQVNKARADIIDMIVTMMPESLFNDTQNEVLHKIGNDHWIMTVIAPPTGDAGNIHFQKYINDGFIPFMPIAEALIKRMDELAEQQDDPSFAAINEYFKKIVRVKDSFEGQDPGAEWYIRAPRNNKGILDVVESVSRTKENWQRELGHFGKSNNWMNILKRPEMQMASPPDDDDDDNDDDKPKFKEPDHKDDKGHIPGFVRKPSGGTLTNLDTGEEIADADYFDSPYGEEGEVTYDYQGGCCEQIKQHLVGIVSYMRPLIHISEIERKIYGMPCHELNEYFEPPETEDNNFHNLEFFGVKISEVEPNELLEAIGLDGSPHLILFKLYDDCVRGEMSMNIIKPPSERTDPTQREHFDTELRPGDEEVFEGELESGQSFREFEGHEWDAAEAGKFDYLPEEAMREESRKVRIEEGKVSDKEWELEGEGAERSKRAYEAQKQGEPTRDSFLKLYDLVNNKGRDMMDPQTRIDSGMTQRQFDKALKNWDEYKKEFGAVQ
jgi:hypothetical protein